MDKVNFDREMERALRSLTQTGERKKLLLHACCAPCSSACIERLKDSVDITIFFYNPNMDSEKEYELRAQEEQRLCENLGVKCIIEKYNPQEFYNIVIGLEKEKEGGKRCAECFELRLEKTANYALNNGYDMFATTLTVSPLKNANLINSIGKIVQDRVGVQYLPSDFKKKNGYLISIELSKKYGLYRQNYCGCEFSKSTTAYLGNKV